MILFEIDALGILAVELECDAPRPVDMDGISDGIEPTQGMESVTWDVHVFRLPGCIESVEATQKSGMKLSIDLRCDALLEEFSQALMQIA